MRIFPVAPHAGAWIETISIINYFIDNSMSRPTRARGLKLLQALPPV